MKPRDVDAHLISISRLRVVGATEVSVQRFRGAVRPATLDDFRKRLAESGARSPYLVVDLSELGSIDSAGLECLMNQAAIQERGGGWLRLASPSPAVAVILGLSGVNETLIPWTDESEAVRDLAPKAA